MDCPHCHLSLAHMYSFGKGVDEDAEQAMRHHLAAADGGLAQAQHNVATHYFSGKGVAVDLAIAAHYYDLAVCEQFNGVSHESFLTTAARRYDLVVCQFACGNLLSKSQASKLNHRF
jgi:TPR repeat protein